MYYIVTFDPIEGATRKQITDAYNRFVKHFEKKIPQFKFTSKLFPLSLAT